MWKKDIEGLTRFQSSVTAHFILIKVMRVTRFSCFLIILFLPLPVWPPRSFDHPFTFYDITKENQQKVVGMVILQIFFHLQVIRILLILFVVLAGAFFLFSQQVLADLYLIVL